MSITLIQLGLKLLKEGSCQVPNDYQTVFKLLEIDVSSPLHLTSLQSVFSESSTLSAQYFEPKSLCTNNINYPINPEETAIMFPDINSESLTILEKYGSFVAVEGCNQIPVYDLFKTAAALNDSLENGKKDEPFLLVTADFSGIQDTVYTISSKGALKTLRARSFMLELLTEHIIYEILQEFESERHAIIYSGGGGFSLLLPNKNDLKEKIENYKDILSRWAYKEFSGKFFIALDAKSFKEEQLKKEAFKELRQSQADKLNKLKRHKFINEFLYINSDGIFEGFFVPQMPEQLSVQTECQITRRDDLPPDKMRDLETGGVMPPQNPDLTKTWVSESCYHQFNLGDKLIEGCRFICRSKKELEEKSHLKFPTKDSKKDNLDYCYYYLSKNSGADFPYWHINSWDGNGDPILYADYARKHGELSDSAQKAEIESIITIEGREPRNGDTATFEGLAASSCGADLIGALRMDVDNMGNLFSEIGSLPELSTKSRMLNIFFKVYLNQICSGNLDGRLVATDIVGKEYDKDNKHGKPGRNVSVIYAGGDDLFILGAWDETTELAFDIQRYFSLFTGGLGISAGLTLHQPKFPLYQMVRKSGEAEHVGKNEIGQKNKTGKKNRIALFYSASSFEIERKIKGKYESVVTNDITDRIMHSISWYDLQTVIDIISFFKGYGVFNGKRLLIDDLPNSLVYQLLEVVREWHENGQLYIPHFLWLMKKYKGMFNKKENGFNEALKHFNILNFPILHLPLMWTELLKRGG